MRTLPDIISTVDLSCGKVKVDGHGYLTNPSDWNTEFATFAAAQENVNLTSSHHDVIAFMRCYLDEHGIAADARHVLKYLSERDGLSKSQSKKVLFALFPYGYVKQACKIAGMRQPRAWSTG